MAPAVPVPPIPFPASARRAILLTRASASRPEAQTPVPASEQTAAGEAHQIDISGMRFSPATLTVKAGDQVTWTQRDSIPHRVVFSDGETTDSPTLGRGQHYSQRFDEPGTHNYVGGLHPSMRGTIQV
jgi:plastocyanin